MSAAIIAFAGSAFGLFALSRPHRIAGSDTTVPGLLDSSRWDIFLDPVVWNFIGQGVVATLKAAAVAAVLALILGVLFALGRSSRNRVLSTGATAVIEFFRSMPLLLVMLFTLLVAESGPFWAVVAGLALCNGAVIGEALRAGLSALPKGQREAALSIGMREWQSRMVVEFPQAFRQMLPVIIAQLVVLLKDTSLGYIVGYNEVIRHTMNNLAGLYGSRYLVPLFVLTVLIYLAMNLTLSWIARRLSHRR
ncbi:amino acid ABC transporter permease [Nocardia sp. 2YAB30]|uniref:amino acid ABC transporter permease n=1 Tax=unclassified Nocardia TaxID=2637762 RepID=UPI003F9E2D7A